MSMKMLRDGTVGIMDGWPGQIKSGPQDTRPDHMMKDAKTLASHTRIIKGGAFGVMKSIMGK
jgi:hypothetical protein